MATKRPGAALQQAAEQGQKLWTGFEIENPLATKFELCYSNCGAF